MPGFHSFASASSSFVSFWWAAARRPYHLDWKTTLPPLNSVMPRPRPKTPEVCPVCGEDVPRGALACPECGADHNSGWREEATAYDGLDLPDENFDYDDFLQREFPSKVRPPGIRPIWWVTAILVLAICIALFLLRN
jgi:hypothetical protein